MKKLILMKGLQSSSKSSFAKQKIKEDSSYIRLNRDDIRAMSFDGWSGKKEGYVTDVEFAAALAASKSGYNLIIDDMNLNPKTQNQWQGFCNENNYELIIKDFTDVPIRDCIERDRLREKRVGQAVIERTALRYGLNDFSSHKNWIIMDLDGTVSDTSERLHYVTGEGKKDWPSFFQYCHQDIVREDVREQVLGKMEEFDAGVIALSGRPIDLCGTKTEDWLIKNRIPYEHLFMRNSGDKRDDTVIKEEILDGILKYIDIGDIVCAFDDRPKICRLWKSRGIEVIDVGEGKEF